jgi:type IV pilus assembly protein PilW
MQENARFAIDFLQADIREAGYKGACGRGQPLKSHLNTSSPDYDETLFDIGDGIFGWEASNGGYPLSDYRAGTDTILVKHGATWSGLSASGNTPVNASTINLTAESGIEQGTIMLISDTNGCELFQKSNATNASTLTKAGGGTPGNAQPGEDFSNHYRGDIEISILQSTIYYIGQSLGGLPSLHRVTYNNGTASSYPNETALVEGISDIQICYGLDNNNDASVDTYLKASAVGDWEDVIAARVTVVAVSPQTNVATEAVSVQLHDCDGTVLTRSSTDYAELAQGRIAQAFTSTIALRNRLLYE